MRNKNVAGEIWGEWGCNIWGEMGIYMRKSRVRLFTCVRVHARELAFSGDEDEDLVEATRTLQQLQLVRDERTVRNRQERERRLLGERVQVVAVVAGGEDDGLELGVGGNAAHRRLLLRLRRTHHRALQRGRDARESERDEWGEQPTPGAVWCVRRANLCTMTLERNI